MCYIVYDTWDEIFKNNKLQQRDSIIEKKEDLILKEIHWIAYLPYTSKKIILKILFAL